MEKATEEQLHAWKTQYGGVHEFDFGDKVLYLKKFDLKTLGLALTFLGKDYLKFGQTLIENNYIAGDKDLADDAEFLLPLCDKLSEIVSARKVEYVKH